MDSVAYYDRNVEAFSQRTIGVDLGEMYSKFLTYVPPGGRILDAGCGTGRDSKYFIERGYDVTPFDGSQGMAMKAAEFLGRDVWHMRFEDMTFSGEFDGVWASASLLHVPYEGLREMIEKIHQALRSRGIFYCSFKYGDRMRWEGERVFSDMTERQITPYLDGLFETIEVWRSRDVRGNGCEWLNCVLRRTS